MGKAAKRSVGTSGKTLEIVEALTELNGASVSELADHLGMGKHTARDLLGTLEEYEYVTRSGDEYDLGLRFLDVGGHTRNQMTLHRMAEPEIRSLATETGERVNLAVEEFGDCVYLDRSKGDNAVELDTYIGRRTTMHNTALGKAMLAGMTEERAERILEDKPLTAKTAQSTTDPDELRAELEEVSDRGYAVDFEERLEGIRCVAAPIESPSKGVLGAISVSGPMNRLKRERIDREIAELVVSAANVIELNITYS